MTKLALTAEAVPLPGYDTHMITGVPEGVGWRNGEDDKESWK